MFVYLLNTLFLQAKLSSIHMTRFHASGRIPSPSHLRDYQEIQEDQDSKDTKWHCHAKACKKTSNGNSPQRTSGPNSRSNSILEFSESFERQLHFKNKRSVSLVGDSYFKWQKTFKESHITLIGLNIYPNLIKFNNSSLVNFL